MPAAVTITFAWEFSITRLLGLRLVLIGLAIVIDDPDVPFVDGFSSPHYFLVSDHCSHYMLILA